jgi:hypothetical protein
MPGEQFLFETFYSSSKKQTILLQEVRFPEE